MPATWPVGARRARRAASLGSCVVVALAAEAHAGDVPLSALARSLRLDPLFLDSPTLVFRFPERVVSRDSVALGFGRAAARSELFATTDGREYGLGATLRNAAAGGFAFSQGSYLPGRPSGSLVQIQYTDSNIFQLGGGGRWGGFRYGATIRGTRYSNESAEGRSNFAEQSAERQVAEYLEGGAGAGFTVRGITCDAVFEWGRTTYENAALYLTQSDTLVTQLDGEPDGETSFAVRLAVPAAEWLRIVAVGEAHHVEVDWNGKEFRDQQLDALARSSVSKTWFTGLSFLFPAPHLDCVAVTGAFEYRDETLMDVEPRSGITTGRRRLDFATFGIAVQRRLWNALLAQAGATTAYRRDYVEGSAEELQATRLQASRVEQLTDGFSCGLSYAWRAFDFAGSLSLPPSADLPFGMIDVYMAF